MMTSRERERHTSELNRHLKEAASSSIADSFPPKEIGGRVLRFTPRKREPRKGAEGDGLLGNAERDHSQVPDLRRFEGRESGEEYQHRMMVNAIAFTYTSVLVIVGIWLTTMMAHR